MMQISRQLKSRLLRQNIYRSKNFHEATDKAAQLVNFGCPCHTSVLYTTPSNTEYIKYFEVHKTLPNLLSLGAFLGGTHPTSALGALPGGNATSDRQPVRSHPGILRLPDRATIKTVQGATQN
jgi:hypothetical protein